MTKNVADNEVDNHEGECANNKTNTGIKDGFFSFFGFAGVARRSHILDAADNNVDNGNEPSYADNGAENASDGSRKSVGGIVITASSVCYGCYSGFTWIAFNSFVIGCKSRYCCDSSETNDAKNSDGSDFKIFFH